VKSGEEAEAWLLGMRKYFQVHDYSGNMKARVAIYNLNDRASIWWEDLKNVKKLSEKKTTWKLFKKYFHQKYLSERYYDGKIKEFHEMKLGQLTMDDYASKFLELLRYVPYIKDEKVKIQHFLSGLPQSYRDMIEFDEPKTLDDTIRKGKYCYEQSKNKPEFNKIWKEKKKEKFEQRKKGFKPPQFKNQSRSFKPNYPA
jgi:hypothetical protein